MKNIDLIFKTDKMYAGYQLGINIELNNKINEKEYMTLYSKILFLFKTISYGMDIAKIREALNIILKFSNISNEDVHSLRIAVLNSKNKTGNDNFTHIEKGVLADDIYDCEYYRDREFYYVKYRQGELSTYFYNDTNKINSLRKRFSYHNKKVEMEYNEDVNTPKRTKSSLNKFFKNNLDVMKKLENIQSHKLYYEIYTNDSILVTTYKLFYNENPDFSDPDIMCKFQCMAAIIHNEVFDVFPSIAMHNYCDQNINTPEVDYIKDQVLKINLILGNNFDKIEEFNFKPGIVNKIKFIGSTINNYISQMPEEDRINFLNQFAINYLRLNYNNINITDKKSKELMLILSKNDLKN